MEWKRIETRWNDMVSRLQQQDPQAIINIDAMASETDPRESQPKSGAASRDTVETVARAPR